MILFDENLSPRLPSQLSTEFPLSKHVEALDLQNTDDLLVWRFAKENSYTILTKDADFNNLLRLYGHPPKVIWLRIGNSTTKQILELLKSLRTEIMDFVNDKAAGLLEVF